MKNQSLEQYYRSIEKKILTAAAYTEDSNIGQIIKSCRLKPLSVFAGTLKSSRLESIWLDEFNQCLDISDKNIRVRNFRQLQKTTTDIFKNETFDFILEHSKWLCLGIHKEEFILLFMGTDNYLRCFRLADNCLSICSPLHIGWQVLKSCWNNSHYEWAELKIDQRIKHLNGTEWFISELPIKNTEHIHKYAQLRKLFNNE